MVSHKAINDIMQTLKKKVHFFFFSVCCIVFNSSWQSIMFDKKQKSFVKRIHLVTDGGLYDRKSFYKVEIVFIHLLWMMVNLSIILLFVFISTVSLVSLTEKLYSVVALPFQNMFLFMTGSFLHYEKLVILK